MRAADLPGAPLLAARRQDIDEEGGALAAPECRLVESGYLVHDKAHGITRPVRHGDIAILAARARAREDLSRRCVGSGIPVATTRPRPPPPPRPPWRSPASPRRRATPIASAAAIVARRRYRPRAVGRRPPRYLATGAAHELWRGGHRRPSRAPGAGRAEAARAALPVTRTISKRWLMVDGRVRAAGRCCWRSGHSAGPDRARVPILPRGLARAGRGNTRRCAAAASTPPGIGPHPVVGRSRRQGRDLLLADPPSTPSR